MSFKTGSKVPALLFLFDNPRRPTIYILAQSTHYLRPVYGPRTAEQGALYVPMAGGWTITKRVFGRWHWDQTDPTKVISWLKSRGIGPMYNGYICFDWEPYSKHPGPFSDAIAGYQLAYDTAKAYCPNAKVGFFGPPGVQARDDDGNKSLQDAAFWAEYMAIPGDDDVIFAQSYIASRLPLRIVSSQRDRAIEQIGIAVDSGKRVISVLSWKIRVLPEGYLPMPPALAAELASSILDAHPSIDGFLLWGWGAGEYNLDVDVQKAALIRALWPVVRKQETV